MQGNLSQQQIQRLIVLQGVVLLPHFFRFSWLVTVIWGVGALWQWFRLRNNWPLPGKKIKPLLVIVGLVASGMTLSGSGKLEGAASFLLVMAALKLWELKNSRDGFVLACTSYFLILTLFLFDQTLLMGAYLLLSIWLITMGLISVNGRAEFSWKAGLKLSGGLVLQSLPLAVVLFLIFPRLSTPLWSIWKESSAKVGLSDQVSPGDFSRLSKTNEVAFRAKFFGERPARSDLYWRAMVLSEFDGVRWRRAPRAKQLQEYYLGQLQSLHQLTPTGPAYEYEITLGATEQRWMFALDRPSGVPLDATAAYGGNIQANSKLHLPILYQLLSYPSYRMAGSISDFELDLETQLPDGYAEQTRQFARDMFKKYPNPQQFVRQVLAWFNQQPFYYTLEPPRLGNNPVDEFLFDSRRGFCGHYASAMAVILREVGLPTRLVSGYLGGEYNPVGNYLIVRQRDAHAWVESWLPGTGWTRIDPTGAVAPERVLQSVEEALEQRDPGYQSSFFETAIRDSWFNGARLAWDSVNNSYNRWLIGYDHQRQNEFLKYFGLDTLKPWQLAALFAAFMGIASMVALSALLLGREKLSAESMAYQAFCRKCARRGVTRLSNEGPIDFQLRLIEQWPEKDAQIDKITNLYIQLRYLPAQAKQRTELVRSLKKGVRSF
ncbi:transglutaminase TgpA family protein [Pelagibaculum spongiae]|uniref:Transglutaminase-like domain-containing protein n=1 Tax=Pelagibaculum spongiae TaxID=2080658 RepID=A0A2V1GZ05_9GAMM|nr:DUF3488 and transglutaminase-like domain-containing protein [Pelagibaculum spongiae]PVZ71679.1 hypothetical protein DC094_01225 [Pelagibaculum spongiae]